MVKIFVFLLLVSFSFGSATKYFQCSRYHKENWSKFGYQIGHTYKYNYTGVVRSSTFSIDSKYEETKLLFSVEVDITSYSPFDFMMQLSNSKFEEYYVNKNNVVSRKSNENQYVKLALSKHPLHFSYQNGRIDTICPGEEEKDILHIKKGILSSFQNSMPNFEKDAVVYETDVNGVCETQYKIVDYNGSNFLVSKTKNLDACSHRKLHILPWSSSQNTRSSIPKSKSLLKSLHTCTQSFDKNFILQSTQCAEEHLFQPFSNQGNGAVTRLSQSLIFLKTTQESHSPTIPVNYKRDTLLFDHRKEAIEKEGDNMLVLKLLDSLERKTTNGIDQDVAKIFSHLTHEFQKMSSKSIYNIFEMVKNSAKKKKFILDLLPLLTSVEGVVAMKVLYQQGEISDYQINAWLTSLTFVKEVSLPVIGELTYFLRIEAVKKKAVLSTTSLIYMYCKKDVHCLDQMEIAKALKIIEMPLLSNCIPTSPDRLNDILLSLKGVGNMGFSHSLDYLRTCYSKSDSPIELRLAAIAAHRRISCAENDNLDQLENYFSSTRQNSEIRIAAYLAAMQCASYATFARVKDVLRTEEISQVGSFVWTHLTNLQETSSKWKQSLKDLVGNEFLRNKFNTDFRRYSRNYEMSTFFESINTGATIESNVIFTPESYLPKSLMLNFTLDLFGESVNLLEVGARVEGYEEIIENLFGPDGYFPEETIRNALESFRDKTENDKIEELRKSFSTIYKEPNGLLYAKIFGNEISYTQFKDFEPFLGSSVNSRSILDSMMKFFRQQDIDYTKSFVFLDTTYRVPTLLGFPLELSINGTATLGLTVSGKVDLKEMWMHKVAIEGKVYASTAVEVVGTMNVDSIVTKTGLRSVSSLNSNIYVDGHAFIDQGKLIDLQFNVPKKQVKIINVESELFLMQGGKSYPIEDVSGDVEEWQGCTEKAFNNVVGFQICSGLRYVNVSTYHDAPYFPFSGKFKFFLNAQKTDDFDSYRLHLKVLKEERNYRPIYSMLLHFDTPNSKVNRKIETSYHLDCEKLTFNTKLTSPFLDWELDTKIGNEHDNLGFVLQTKSNNREILLAELSLISNTINNTWTYEPFVRFKYKDVQIVAVSGIINYLRGQKYNANLVFDGFVKDPIEILGDLHIGVKKFQLTGSVKSKEINGNTRATIVRKPGIVSIVTKTTYDYRSIKNQVIDFTFKYHSAKKKTLTEEMFYIFLNSTQMSFYNTLLHFNIYKDKLYFESDGMVTLFEETWQTRQLFKYLKTSDRNDIALQCTLSCTKRQIDYEFNLSYIKSRRIFKTHGLAQLSKVKRIEVLIDYNATIPDNQTFNFLLYFPRQEVTVKGILAQKTLEQYKFHFESFYEINDTKESVLTVSGDYRNLTLGDFQNHTLLAYVKVPKEIENTMNPWILELSLQMSSDLFLTTSELRVSENCYKSTIALAQNGFSGLLQINDKKLLIIHGEKEDDVLTIFLSLNVYQHFELSFKLLLPYQQLQVTLYWDKDRNMDNKISLLVDTNVKKGLYMLDLEYPRQKIMACFILLPTQVTVNVTWGIDDFQRIYLKAGNKLYDIGGIWFAKLETPLKYLEYQEFQLSYYLFPDNAEFKVDVSWQNQTINLILSGRKSKSKVSGYLDVNTTIPEISKIGIAMNHDQQNINGILRVKNDGTIILNNYQIIGQNIWQSNKFNVSTSFDIVSSGLFSPIWGSLIIHSNESSNAFKGSIKWKNKTVSIDYKLENQKCHAVIVTPFRGLEYTDLKYILIEEKDKLFFEMEMNIFKHHNRAVFFWSYSLDKSVTELNIISPLVGGYNISIGHNMKYGHLNEYFVITHGYQNEIVNAKLKGDFLSILAMNLTASIRFLKEEASVIVKNSDNPINSLIIVNWNKQYIKNALGIHLEDKRVVELNWNFTSTLLRENAMCKYLQNDNTYLVSIELPRHLKFKNVFTFKNTYKEVDNTLTIETSLKNCSFNYFHTLSPDFRKFDSEIFISTDNKESKIIFQGISNENLGSIASLQLTLYLHKPVHLKFSLGRNSMTSWNSNFYVAYDNNRIVNIDSYVHLTYLGSTMSMSFMFENYPDFDVFAKYDFISNPNAINLVLVKENFSFEVSSKFYLNPNRGSVSFNVTSNSDMERSLLNCNLNFNLENNSAQGSFEVLVPEQMYKYLLARYDIISNGNEQTDMSPPTTLKNWDKLFCNFFVSFHNMEGNFVAGVNNQTVTTKYNIKKSSKNKKTDINAQISIGSDFDIIKNGSLSAFYNENQNSRNFNVFGLFDNHEIQLQSYYDFNFTAQEQIYNSNIFGKVNVNYENLLSSGSEKYTLKMKILGKSKINKTSAQILTELDTNVPYFEKIKGEAVFKKLNYGHNVRGNLSYNNRYYNIHENFHNKNGSCFGVIEMTTPSLFGNFSGTLFSGDISLIEIKAVLRNYSKWYNMSISSSYKSLLNIDTFIDVTVPKSKYEGRVTNLITSNEMNCNAVINIAKHKNFVKLKMQYPNLEKIKVTAEASLPSSQFTVTKLNALYNFGKRNKFSLLQIKTNYGYNLNSTIDTKSLNINFSTPSANKGLVILGKHDFESVQNFSISYNVFFNKFWERVRFLYLQDDSVFHAQLLLGDENAEIKLDKDGLFRDQTILRTNYKDYALNIWSGKEKTYLTITNPSTIYKIQVNYISNYKQYGFEVFQDEMSLIDVTTTIIERNGYLQLQTRATNSLLSQYSDVVISLIYQTSELNFIVTNNNITAISVYYRSEESTFQFDLNSCFEDLKALQAIVEFQEDVEIRLIKKQRNLEDTYLFGFSFVPEKHRAGLKISLPCQNQVCLLDFSLKDNFIKLHAKTPIDQWKELKFLSMFIREDNFLSGEMQILLNEEYLLTNWVLEKNNDDVLGFFNIKGTRWQHILAKAVINKEKVHFIFEMNNIDCSIFNVKRMNINATFGSITNSKFSINYESQDEVYYNVDSILKLNDGNNTLKLLLSDDSYKTGVIFQSNILANHISSNVSSFILLDYFKNFKFDSKVFFKGGQFGFRYNNENDVDYWAPSSINIFLLQPSLGRVTLHTTFDKQTQMLNIAFNNETVLAVRGAFSDSIYFVNINLTTCHHHGTVFSNIDFTKTTMLVNGFGYSEKKPIKLNLNFNFNELELALETPFDPVKTFQIRGKLVTSVNMYNINATGVWNSDRVEYYGNMKTDQNFSIHSQLKIGELSHGLLHFDLIKLETTKKIYLICEYPSDKNNYQLLGNLETESDNINFNFEAKTPFQSISRFLVHATGSSNTVQFEAIADSFNQSAGILFDALCSKPLQFYSNLKTNLPHINTVLRLTTKVDNNTYGYVQVEDVIKNKNFSITYEKLDSRRFLRCKIEKKIYELEMDLINALNKLEIVYSEILENVNEVRANAKIGIFNNSLIDSEISVRGMTQFFIKILVSETIDKIYFCLNDSVLFYLDQTKSPKLQIKISNLINASVSSNGSSFDLNVNSDMPKFKNALIQTAWSLNSQRRMLTINFENFGKIKNGKTIVNVQNQEYKFITLLFNDSAAFLNVSAEVVLDSNIRGTVYAAIYDLEHFANCTIKRHGLNDFSIVSSFLPYNVVTLQLNNTISAPSFLLFFGEDSPNFLKRSFGHSYILLQYWSNENQFFFKFDAPNNLQYSFLKIYGKLRIDNTSVIFSNNLEVKSAITKNLNLRTEAHLTANDAKLSIYYTLPFTGIHSELDFDFHIPFSFSNNFVPKVCIHLPKSNFSLHCIVKYAPNEFCISGGHEFSSERSNLLLHVVNDDTKVLPKINFNYTVPYVSNTPVKFALEQKENVINSHLSILDWQAQSFLIFKTNHYLNITLFSLTKKISAEIQYQNAPNIFVSALLSHPHYPKKLGISFDAFCRDFKKVHINGMVAIPTVLTTEFALQNNLYYSSEFKQYGLISAVKINDFNLDLSINSSIEENFLHFMINTEVDSFRFLINFNYDECALDKINFLCEVQTPMPPFTDFRASLVVPKNLINGINTSLSYNKKPIVHLDLHTIPNNFSINFYNVLLPLSIECKYLKSGVFELSGNICWDFNSSSNSQLGGHIYLGNNISIGFVTPSRVMAFDTRTFKNLQNTYYFGRLSWFKNEEISVSLSFTNNTLKSKIFETHHIVVSFPFRTFEITNELETDLSVTKYVTNLKWDLSSTSNIRLNYEAMPGKTFTKLFVPIWEHEIILNVHQSMSNMPMYVKTELMYSNDTNKHITFEVFNNEDIFKTEKMIILQHPSSKINYTIRLLTNRLPHASYGNISLSYTNYMLKRQEEIRGFLKISHERFEVYGEIETTKNYVSILSALTSGPHYQRLLNILQLNQKDPFVVEGVYNFKETGPSVSLVSSYGKERRYDLYGGFPSKREFTIKLSRTIYDEQMIEGHFNIKLNTSQMLSVKLLWKKDILWEYYNMIFNEYSDTKYIIESIGREIIDVIEDDVGQELIIDFQNIRDNINLYINEEIRLLSNDYLNFLNDLEDGYQSNSFYYKYIQETIETIFPQFSYLRDILVEPFWDFFQEVFDQLTLALQDIYSAVYDIYHLIQQQIEFAVNRLMQIKKFKEDAKRILRTVIDDVRLFLHRLENVFIELIDDIDQNVTSIKQQCLNFLRPYLNRLEDFIAYVEQRLAILQMLVLDILDTIQNYVVNLRESKELIKMYVIYINWLEEFHISQILEPIADVLEQALATVINDFKKITEDYNPYLEAIFGRYEAINEVPALVEFRKTISTFSHRILWIWNHHNLTDLMKNQVHQYVSNFDNYLVSIVTYNSSSTSDFENFFQSSNYIFRPDIGIIEITQPLPVEWDTFDSLPQFHQHPLYDKIKEKAESLIKIQKHHFGDMINTIKSYIGEPSEYILSPPTNNIAMVIGDSNFFTFDKKYFKFKGNCSYILTAEFLTTTFAVEINYDPERVITISMPHSILKILSNSTVLENDVKANLPIITGSLIVLQENYEIVVDYAKGLKVICNLYYNYCSVQLSGWLFGKVGGLLGTLDNDMSTDFNLPDGNKADDIQHFAESWKVGDCQSSNQLMLENNTTHISPLSITLFETLCQLFFTNVNSPLASCFNIIDTDPFYDICVNDMKDIKNLSLCSSIAAYRARCKYSSIDVEMPEMCIHCNYNIGEKEEIFDKTTPKSIDVVIIKEMNCFNNNAYLTYLAKQLDEDFIKTGFKNNRFSIVGYGSDKPYIYFSKNKVWMDPKTLSFDIKILPKIYLNNHKSISQTLDFILSKLEFRPGVSKQFITISCSSTDEDEDINNLRLIFGEKDITMHLMKLNAVKKTSKNTLFAQNKLAVNSSLIEDINAVLKHEKDAIDVITLLALSSEGTAFHVNTKTKLTDNKILNAVSKTISLTAKQSPCQRCKCVSNPDGTGKIDCTRCMSPIVKQLLNEYEANGIVFP